MSEWAVSRQRAKGGQVKRLERITCKKRRKEKEEKEKDENKDKKKEQAKEQIESATQLQAVLLIHQSL